MQRDHPGEPVAVKVIGKAAGDQWRDMSAEAREPYEQKSTENKKSYALLKTLTPQVRAAWHVLDIVQPALDSRRSSCIGYYKKKARHAPPSICQALRLVATSLVS